MAAGINTGIFCENETPRTDMRTQRSYCLLYVMILFFVAFNSSSSSASQTNDAASCLPFGAEYVPQDQIISDTYDENRNDINETLSFVLRIEKGDMCCKSTLRNIFLNFDAYNKEGVRVSTMRLGDVWSNGVSRQGFSSHYGQYCDFGKDGGDNACEEKESAIGFDPIGITKDLRPASVKQAPYLLIFPGTYRELRYSSLQRPEEWDQYIKFYTEDRVYPDFRGYDFWVRKKCGDGAYK